MKISFPIDRPVYLWIGERLTLIHSQICERVEGVVLSNIRCLDRFEPRGRAPAAGDDQALPALDSTQYLLCVVAEFNQGDGFQRSGLRYQVQRHVERIRLLSDSVNQRSRGLGDNDPYAPWALQAVEENTTREDFRDSDYVISREEPHPPARANGPVANRILDWLQTGRTDAMQGTLDRGI
jgi:hypothetical protein